MDTAYGAVYRRLYMEHWWWRAREEVILDQLRRRRPVGGWRRSLDVGCGDGLFFDRLAEFGEYVNGVEPDENLVESGGPYRDRIHVGPLETLRRDRSYGLIVMLDVLEHMEDAIAGMRLALDLLEPDGTFLATVPAFNALWTNHDVINHHVRRYTKTSFRAQAARAGLRIDVERYFFHWMWPVKLFVRGKELLTRSSPAVPHVPARWLNQFLLGASRLEYRTVGRLPVPFGSSLLVVGGQAGGFRSRAHGVSRE